MYQGTTPSYTLSISGYDLSDATVFVTLESGKKQFTLTGEQLEVEYDTNVTTITFGFSQEETFRLPLGAMNCQVRWVTSEGDAFVTDVAHLEVNPVLLRKVIEYDGGDE